MENTSTSTVRVASVADYDSSEEQELDSSRKVANSAVKRTSQTNLTTCSDSGYSSLTQTTTSSVTDTVAAKPKSMAAADSNSQTSTGSSRRRRATESGAQQPQPTAAPTPKKKIKIVQCKDPGCPECVAAREREQRGRKSNRRVTISSDPTPEKSPVKKASSDTQPSRPSRRPAPQPLQTPGVRRPSASTGARPKSMYDVPAKMMPPPMYSRGTYPAGGFAPPGAVAIVERPGIGTRGISARKAHPVSITQLPTKLSARRTMQPSVIMDSDSEDEEEEVTPKQVQPSRRQQPQQQQVALRQRPVKAIEPESEPSSEEDDVEEEDSEDSEEEEDLVQAAAIAEAERRRQLLLQHQANAPAELQRRIAAAEARHLAETQAAHLRALELQQSMPPPHMPASSMALTAPKYSMRTATQSPHITYGDRRPSMHDHDDFSRPTMREHSVGTSSTRRPSLASSGGTKATSYSYPNASGNARVVVEGTRGRRLSYVGVEDHHGLAAMHEQFVQPPRAAPDFQTIIADAVRQQMEQLQLGPTQTARTKMVDVDDRVQQALKYQQGIDASASRNLSQVPLTADALRRKQSDPSQTGSNRSSEDSFTRISAGHRLPAPSENGTMTVTGDEMTVRIDPDKGFEMDFEGRRVTLLPAADGAVDLIIGGKRETTYTTRGSTINGSRVGGSKIGRTPTVREPTRERDYAREPIQEYPQDRANDFFSPPAREAYREPVRDPRERDPRDRELRDRDREAEPLRERARVRRDREDRRHQARERKQAEYTDYESETEYDEPPPPRARAGGRRRAETSWDDRTERAAPVRRPPPPAPRYSHRAERDDDYDDYTPPPPQRRSRQEAPYAPGPVSSGYNGRGPKGPPSAVFGA